MCLKFLIRWFGRYQQFVLIVLAVMPEGSVVDVDVIDVSVVVFRCW